MIEFYLCVTRFLFIAMYYDWNFLFFLIFSGAAHAIQNH